MRIKRLTIAGFGPYKTEQQVDFSRFDDDGIFLITGKTGAGKSTILDAICFALYSSVPRYDGTQAQLRSDHAEPDDPTLVRLDFTVNGIEYRVERSPEYARPKKRGEGMAVQAHRAQLSRRSGDEWETFAAKPVDVANELAVILPLSKDQFLQVILLAQNRFQEFLLAKNDARQAVLRSLFGTRRFERIEERLTARRQKLGAEVEEGVRAIAGRAAVAASLTGDEQPPEYPQPEWYDSAQSRLGELLAAAKAQLAEADALLAAAELEYRERETTVALQRRRASAEQTLQQLSLDEETRAAERTVLDSARRASSVWPLVTALEKAEREAAAASADEAAAQADYAATLASAGEDGLDSATDASAADELYGTDELYSADALHAAIDGTAKQLGALASVLADEQRLGTLDADLERLALERDRLEASLAECAALVDAAPEKSRAANDAVTAARLAAAREPEARASVERLEAALAAARSEAALVVRQREADEAELAASRAHSAAAAELESLLDRRLGGHAAELASRLVDGEPCAVCGSTTHPLLASWDGEPVTEELVREARASVAECWGALAATQEQSGVVAAQLVEARTRADNHDAESLEAAAVAARDALTLAAQSAERLPRLEESRERLEHEHAALASRTEKFRNDREELARELGDRGTRRDAIRERLDEHRAGFATVAQRAEQLERELASAKRLETARELVRQRSATLEEADRAAAAEALLRGFGTLDDAIEARRSDPELDTLDARIRRHDERSALARATLAEPELSGLPAEPVDLEPAATVLDATRRARDTALSAVAEVEARAAQLAALADDARPEFASSALLRDEFRQVRELANAVQGLEPNTKRMRLETYVLAAQLEEIVAAANVRLKAMTYGRYRLEHDDSVQFRNTSSGLGLSILDEHTGRTRATHSLSGGETFLASLALALGLAEVVSNQAGGITLDTLFVDEGFGSLDAETLATAMTTLDGLRAGGRTVGLISHVDAMREQIPAKLRITVSPEGYSVIDASSG